MSSSNSLAFYLFGYMVAQQSWTTQDTYISLHTGDPAGTTGLYELSNATYSRVTATDWNVISTATSVTTNSSAITFATDGNAESVTHAGLNYGLSAGTLLMSGALDSAFAYNNAVTPVFDAGSLKLRGS